MFVVSEYVEGAVKVSSHKEGYPPQHTSKKLRKASRYVRDLERNYMDHNNNNVLPQSSQGSVHVDQRNDQIKVHDGLKVDPSKHLSKYNNLLKAGRYSNERQRI